MKNVIKIIVAITVVVGLFNCGQMNMNPTDEEIALCNQNPDSCNIGSEIVLENGNATTLTKDTGGMSIAIKNPISATLNKDTGGMSRVLTAQ